MLHDLLSDMNSIMRGWARASDLQPVIISNETFMKYYVAKLPYGLEMRTKQAVDKHHETIGIKCE